MLPKPRAAQAGTPLRLGDPTWNTVFLANIMSKGRRLACHRIQTQSPVFRVTSCVQDATPRCQRDTETRNWWVYYGKVAFPRRTEEM